MIDLEKMARGLDFCCEDSDECRGQRRRNILEALRTVEREARNAGLKEGFGIAQEHAEVETHNGYHPIEPHVDWRHAERLLNALLGLEQSK